MKSLYDKVFEEAMGPQIEKLVNALAGDKDYLTEEDMQEGLSVVLALADIMITGDNMKTSSFYLYKGNELIAEAVDIGGTLHVHYYDSRGSFQYKFGQWPKLKYVRKESK